LVAVVGARRRAGARAGGKEGAVTNPSA